MSQQQEHSTNPTPLTNAKSSIWDKSIENVLIKSALGFAVGSVSSFIFARAPTTRMAIVGMGVGIGAGIAYKENAIIFEQNNL